MTVPPPWQSMRAWYICVKRQFLYPKHLSDCNIANTLTQSRAYEIAFIMSPDKVSRGYPESL